jgi:hypothetical protein
MQTTDHVAKGSGSVELDDFNGETKRSKHVVSIRLAEPSPVVAIDVGDDDFDRVDRRSLYPESHDFPYPSRPLAGES